MVIAQQKDYFCEPNGCKRNAINVFLPKKDGNHQPARENYNSTNKDGNQTTGEAFPIIPIVVTAILSSVLTLSIVGIVLRVLRYSRNRIYCSRRLSKITYVLC